MIHIINSLHGLIQRIRIKYISLNPFNLINKMFHGIKKFLPYFTSGVNGYVDVRDVVNAMILLMASNLSGERFVLNAENLSMKDFFSKAADCLGKPHPKIAVNAGLLNTIAWLDEMGSRITGRRPLITCENVRSVMSKSYYSADKFKSGFNYTFIPVENSLKNAFRILQIVKE